MMKYSLESRESTRLVRIFQIVFGIICILTAFMWALYMIKAPGEDRFWVATIFILCFGAFQIYSGTGRAAKFVIIDEGGITIRKRSLGKAERFAVSELERICILPLSVKLVCRSGRTFSFSFPVTLAEGIDRIKDAVEEFGTRHGISTEEKSEGLK